MKSKIICLLIFLIGLSILLPNCGAISVGVSPGTITFKNLLRGGYAEQQITISSSGRQTLVGRVYAKWEDGEDWDWVSFDTNTFEVEGRTLTKIRAFIRPPDDVSNGEYKGLIYVALKPKEVYAEEGTAIGIGAAAAIKTTAIITDREIKRWTYQNIEVKDIEEGNPIEVKLTAINTGNVRIRPEIKVEILDQMKQKVVKSVDYSETEILPTAREEILITIPTDDLKLGQYWARITMYQDGRQIGQEIMTFDYLERGALRVKGVLNSVRSSVWTQVGDTSRIDAIFSNIGEMVTMAKAKFQILLDGALKDVVESEEMRVEVGETVNLTAFYKPQEVGKYEIIGIVYYSGKITEEKSTILNVNQRVVSEAPEEEEEAPPAGADYTWVIILLIVIIVALFAIRIINVRRRRGGRRRRSGLSGY